MKTAVITGGNSGVGKATAIELAKKGYRTIIHGRDAQKTEEAEVEIKKITGSNRVEHVVADISTIAGMHQLAEAIRHKAVSIEVLVLSTGVILPKHVITADGLEAGFAVQYLSRFSITQLLMPELQSGNARIVQVGAPLLKGARIFFDDIALKSNFSMMKALAQEMLANHLFVQEFARRNPHNHVVMNMIHPGIAKTGIMRESNQALKLLVQLFGKSPEFASRNAVFLANDPTANFSGYFLNKPGKPGIKEKIALDASDAEKLWDMSKDLIGLA